MKKEISVLMVSLFALLGMNMTSAHAAGENYAFVDVAKLFDNYQKTKDQDMILQKAAGEKETGREAIVQEIRKMKDELELLTEDAKKAKQEAMDKKVRELQDFDAEARRVLGEQRQAMIQEIFNDIDKVVQAYGAKKNLNFILNDKALLYFRKDLNVTEEILKELNGGYKK